MKRKKEKQNSIKKRNIYKIWVTNSGGVIIFLWKRRKAVFWLWDELPSAFGLNKRGYQYWMNMVIR